MKKYLRLSALILLAALLVSCGEAEPAEADVTGSTPESEETTWTFLSDNLQDGADFKGETVDILVGNYNNSFFSEMYSDEETGNRLSDTVYTNIRTIQEKLNLTLAYTSLDYYPGTEELEFPGKITARIMAGDDDFDLLFANTNFMAQMLEGNYFVNLAKTKYIDLEKPWYDRSVVEASPTDYVHFITGSFSLANIKYLYGTYFNADLYESLGRTENLYQLVDEGKWTVDKLTALIKDTYSDVNGNTQRDDKDVYGLTFGDLNKYVGFLTALNGSIIEKTAKGYEFTFDSEHTTDIMQKLCRLVNENENCLPAKSNDNNFPDYQIETGGGCHGSRLFTEGRALFTCSLLSDAATIVPSIDFEYGLLPYPKWDEAQRDYQSGVMRSCYAMIPVTATNPDTASAALEALSCLSYETLVPEYCEVTMKVRYSPDNDVSRMFDIIRSNVIYDTGILFNALLNYPSVKITNSILNNDTDWSSSVAALKSTYIDKMNSVVENFKAN